MRVHGLSFEDRQVLHQQTIHMLVTVQHHRPEHAGNAHGRANNINQAARSRCIGLALLQVRGDRTKGHPKLVKIGSTVIEAPAQEPLERAFKR